MTTWKQELLKNASSIFDGKSPLDKSNDGKEVDKLHAKIGQ